MTVTNPTELRRCFFGAGCAELLLFCTVLLPRYRLTIKGKLNTQSEGVVVVFGWFGYLPPGDLVWLLNQNADT